MFFQAEDGIRDVERSRGLGDVYKRQGTSCSQNYHGAWWYKHCYRSNLNGKYMGTSTSDIKSNNWYDWEKSYESLKTTRMMIRPANFLFRFNVLYLIINLI